MLRFTAVAQRLREKVRGHAPAMATPRPSPQAAPQPPTHGPDVRPAVDESALLSPLLMKLIRLAQWGERDREGRRRIAASVLAVLAVAGGTYVFVSLPDGHPEQVWQQEDFLVFDRITRMPAVASDEDAEATADVSASAQISRPTVDPFLTEPTTAAANAQMAVPPDSAWQQPVDWQSGPQLAAQPISNKMIHSAHFAPSPASAAAEAPRGAWLTGGIETAEAPPIVTAQRPEFTTGPVIQPGPARTATPAAEPATSTAGPLLVPSLNPLGNH